MTDLQERKARTVPPLSYGTKADEVREICDLSLSICLAGGAKNAVKILSMLRVGRFIPISF